MAERILKAVEFDKTSAKFRKKYADEQALYDAGWYMQPKFDGCYGMAILAEDKATMLSRTGEDYSVSCANILADLQALLPIAEFGEVVVIGEVWDPEDEFKNISGRFRRQSVTDPKLIFMAHDLLPIGLAIDTPYRMRYAALRLAFNRHGTLHEDCPTTKVRRVRNVNPKSVADYAAYLKAKGGYDGAMLKDPEAPYTIGLAKDGQLVKVKPSLSLDLRVDAVHEAVGEKTGRPVFTISVTYRGKTSMVGSGMPHSREALPQPGQIVEVEAMGLTPEGLLREPRFKGIRFDKEQPDT